MNKILFVVLLVFTIIYGCDKEKNTEPNTAPVIKDIFLDSVSNNAAIFTISFESGGLKLLEAGVCYDTVPKPMFKGNNYAKADLFFGSRKGYDCFVGGLTPGTEYYARAYGINAVDTTYSYKQISFHTDTFKFEATVKYKGLDCGETYIIWLNSSDENSIIVDGNYYADDLSSEFKIPGLKIRLNCREPNIDELYPCTHMGPTFPHVVVTGCKKVKE